MRINSLKTVSRLIAKRRQQREQQALAAIEAANEAETCSQSKSESPDRIAEASAAAEKKKAKKAAQRRKREALLTETMPQPEVPAQPEALLIEPEPEPKQPEKQQEKQRDKQEEKKEEKEEKEEKHAQSIMQIAAQKMMEKPKQAKARHNYKLAGDAGDVDCDEVDRLLAERMQAKRNQLYDVADELKKELRESHRVFIDDKARKWKVNHQLPRQAAKAKVAAAEAKAAAIKLQAARVRMEEEKLKKKLKEQKTQLPNPQQQPEISLLLEPEPKSPKQAKRFELVRVDVAQGQNDQLPNSTRQGPSSMSEIASSQELRRIAAEPKPERRPTRVSPADDSGAFQLVCLLLTFADLHLICWDVGDDWTCVQPTRHKAAPSGAPDVNAADELNFSNFNAELYKTSMCSNFPSGSCRYGPACSCCSFLLRYTTSTSASCPPCKCANSVLFSRCGLHLRAR